MVSNSSKALPYVSLGVGFIMAIFAVMGYGAQVDKVLGFLAVVLPITAGGGLINKAIEASVEKKKAFLEDESLKKVVETMVAEINEAKKQPEPPK